MITPIQVAIREAKDGDHIYVRADKRGIICGRIKFKQKLSGKNVDYRVSA